MTDPQSDQSSQCAPEPETKGTIAPADDDDPSMAEQLRMLRADLELRTQERDKSWNDVDQIRERAIRAERAHAAAVYVAGLCRPYLDGSAPAALLENIDNLTRSTPDPRYSGHYVTGVGLLGSATPGVWQSGRQGDVSNDWFDAHCGQDAYPVEAHGGSVFALGVAVAAFARKEDADLVAWVVTELPTLLERADRTFCAERAREAAEEQHRWFADCGHGACGGCYTCLSRKLAATTRELAKTRKERDDARFCLSASHDVLDRVRKLQFGLRSAVQKFCVRSSRFEADHKSDAAAISRVMANVYQAASTALSHALQYRYDRAVSNIETTAREAMLGVQLEAVTTQRNAVRAELERAKEQAGRLTTMLDVATNELIESRQEAERRNDCHGGPGTTEDACEVCVSCLVRRSTTAERERDEAREHLKHAVEACETNREAADTANGALLAAENRLDAVKNAERNLRTAGVQTVAWQAVCDALHGYVRTTKRREGTG